MGNDLTENIALPIGQLRWLCRRGMKELDILFEHYLNQYYQSADQVTQQVFMDLLNTPDPIIMDYITGKVEPDSLAKSDILALMQQR